MRKLLFFAILSGTILISCKKNDSGSGQPLISGVRLVDSTKRDSTFTKAIPGTEIVIQGSNLGGLQAVYFNDTSAFFNPVYATNSNIIIVIPSTAQTLATDPKVPNTIKVVTNHGTATYSFSLYLPPPSISSISFDNSGTLVYINGSNFTGIQKITFPITGAPDTALSYTVNKTGTLVTAVIPPGTALKDSLRVYCTFGNAAYSYPPPMTITSVSNENAVAGTIITFTGTNFVGIDSVFFPGGLLGTNIQPLGATQFSVTVPPGITAPDSLRISGGLGVAVAPQLFDSYITHPYPGYLTTFESKNGGSDSTGFLGWTGGYASAGTTVYPNATGAVAFIQQSSPMPPNTAPGSQGNGGFIQLNDVKWISNTSASISGYSLKFEVYTVTPWKVGEIWIMMGDWYGWSHYMARYAPWTSAQGGVFQPSGWVTATIPLTQFLSVTQNEWNYTSFPTSGSPASIFSDYASTALCFAIVNDQSSPAIPANTLNIAIDNVRIVNGQ